MKFRPFARVATSQFIAIGAFLLFLKIISGVSLRQAAKKMDRKKAEALLFVSMRSNDKPDKRPTQGQAPRAEPIKEKAPRKPQRFRPSATRSKSKRTPPELPPAVPSRPSSLELVHIPQRELPLSYLMKFKSLEEFHSFLDKLPEQKTHPETMSLIRIEGLPRTIEEMKRLFESYDMKPFLFNPYRFNYIITSELKLLCDRSSIADYIVRVGRYLTEERPNQAYSAIRQEMIKHARANKAITERITEPEEFERMLLGLASANLNKFFRRLERDTARQLSELLGKTIRLRDISRIDCRFRNVNGAMVLVPWQAYLGDDPTQKPVKIWKDE